MMTGNNCAYCGGPPDSGGIVCHAPGCTAAPAAPPTEAGAPTHAIALTVAVESPLPWQPRDPTEAYRLAKWLAQSELVPDALRGKPYSILHVIMAGHDLGLTAMQSLERLHVIKGKIGMTWQEIVRRVLESPLCEYFFLDEEGGIGESAYAVYVTRRVGWPEGRAQRCRWDIARAREMGLAGKDNWKRMPGTMCKRRSATELARDVYPDVLGGAYDLDELAEIPVLHVAPDVEAAKALRDRLKARAQSQQPAQEQPTREENEE